MNYTIFDNFPSVIFVLEGNTVIYVNVKCSQMLSIAKNTQIQDLQDGNLTQYCQDSQESKTINIQNKLYYIRSIQNNDHKIIEIQDMNIDSCHVIINNVNKEVRSPLHGIAGMIEIISSTVLSDKQREYIDMIRECSSDLLHIINNVVDYIKILEGRLKLKTENNDLNICIQETKSIIEYEITKLKNDVDLIYDVETFDSEYIFDTTKLQQVILNILKNAAEHTMSGTITLSVKKLMSQTDKDKIEFTVVDSGIGIKKDDMNKLFKPFCKLNKHTHTINNRIGLGLVISKHLINMMGGEIGIESIEQTGTTVTFTVCFLRNSITPLSLFESKMKTKNVLIIDQSSEERYDLSSFVINNGLDVIAVPSIKEAVTIYLKNNYKFDYIICNPKNNDDQDVQSLVDLTHNEILITIDKDIRKGNILIESPIDFNQLKNILYYNNKPQSPSNEKRILLVEDQKSNQLVLTKYLNNMGFYNVDIANHGQEAIIKVLQNSTKYDLILMDIMMPVMNGIDATKNIMNMNNENVIVGITADITATDEVCRGAGMRELLFKPVNYDKFKLLCERYLR